ncbi:MAG TPA: membrane protein insertion efficiency factor YidD [Bacteroidia bacterium]|nr:membrane protein insertion efficiency factor YidD [Bacteroidia bacterium]
MINFGFSTVHAQNSDSMRSRIIGVSFGEQEIATAAKSVMKVNKSYELYNPFYWIGAGLMYLYQNVLSEQIQARCTYRLSCSQYTKLSIQQHGLFKGSLMGFNQVSECFPAVIHEHCAYLIDGEDHVVNDGNED